jgi:putative SOS response-associated peptidase YedK
MLPRFEPDVRRHLAAVGEALYGAERVHQGQSRQEPDDREAVFLKWGLVPRWAKDPAVGNKLFNARSETVTEKPSFREAFARRRCLVPMEGFYEWARRGDSKRPFYFHMRDGEPFAVGAVGRRGRAAGDLYAAHDRGERATRALP